MASFEELPVSARAALDTIAPLSFSIVARSIDGGEPWAVGSGVFVAPFIALTARHVLQGTWNEFEPPRRKNKYPKGKERTTHSLALIQKLHAGRSATASWVIEEAWPDDHTDIALLRVTPHDDVAKSYQWGAGFLKWQLLAPPAGTAIYAFGYPLSTATNAPNADDGVTGELHLSLMEATVTRVEEFRRDNNFNDFPGFEFRPGIAGGYSGGPLFAGDRLCGIASASGFGGDGEVGYAATLWPLVLRKIKFGLGEAVSILELLKLNFFQGVDAEDVEQRIFVDLVNDGGIDGPKEYVRLRSSGDLK